MKRVIFLLFFSVVGLLSLSSCGDNEYEFVGSRQGVLYYSDQDATLDDMINMRNGSKSISVAVDLYRKKVKDGYMYKVKSQEGNEYELPNNIVRPSNDNPVLVVVNFRYNNYIGELDVRP